MTTSRKLMAWQSAARCGGLAWITNICLFPATHPKDPGYGAPDRQTAISKRLAWIHDTLLGEGLEGATQLAELVDCACGAGATPVPAPAPGAPSPGAPSPAPLPPAPAPTPSERLKKVAGIIDKLCASPNTRAALRTAAQTAANSTNARYKAIGMAVLVLLDKIDLYCTLKSAGGTQAQQDGALTEICAANAGVATQMQGASSADDLLAGKSLSMVLSAAGLDLAELQKACSNG